MFWTLAILLLLVVTGGFISYYGDLQGRRWGKRRVSWFGMRPKHTAILITSITGSVIALLTVGAVMLAAPNVANVILHESVHATVFIPDEPFFNEGFAEYIADRMADDWVRTQFGETSAELVAYRDDQAERATRTARELRAYDELAALYAGHEPDAVKLAKKAAIIDAMVADLRLRYRPDNASLIELRVYRATGDGFATLQAACGGSLERMLAAGKRLRRADFAKDLEDDLAPVLRHLADLCR